MTDNARPLAILVAVRLPDVDAAASDASLDELARLVTTLGYDVVERISKVQRGAQDRPVKEVKVNSVKIERL